MLDRVTLTGADDSVEPEKLIELWREFPYVEWGILYSERHQGVPRFPTSDWVIDLAKLLPGNPLPLSLHLCGSVVRRLLLGERPFGIPQSPHFQRLQLNFHREPAPINPPAFDAALRQLGKRQIIFQFDGAKGEKYLDAIYEEVETAVDYVPLFDASGGAGVVPGEWPKPIYLKTDCDFAYHGYAGGLGPDNLLAEIDRITAACRMPHMNEPRFWIDMETKIRSDDGARFDLAKCRRALELVQPLIGEVISNA